METKRHGRPRSAKKRTCPRSKSLKQIRRKSLHNDCSNHGYYGMDEDEYSCRSVHRYSTTSFPLFSNKSDDEVIKNSRSVVREVTKKLASQMMVGKERYNSHSAGARPPLSAVYRERCRSQPNISAQYFSGSNSLYPLPLSDHVSYISGHRGIFPFQNLPYELKMKVFTYLNHLEKGVAMLTCREWHDMLGSPVLWSTVLLSDFPMSCVPSANHEAIDNCYACYNRRVHLFSCYLFKLQPVIKKLEFKFDIGEKRDHYLQMLNNIISQLNLNELQSFHFNWKETPARPFWSPLWSRDRCNDDVFHHRHRSRLFTYVFDDLTKKAQKITTLVMPFDWLERSVESLIRLKNLHNLVLEKYFVFQTFKQAQLDLLLSGLPNLKRLLMEVWTPSGLGLVPFSMASHSIVYLDLSQSRGFHLRSVDLPKLTQIHVVRHPWNGPLVCRDRIHIPCIYTVLMEGAPNLCKINDHCLLPEWRENIYPSLEKVLKSVCSCSKHKIGWSM